MNRLELLFNKIKPQFCDSNILYWKDLTENKKFDNIVLYGAGKAGTLIADRLINANITPLGFIDKNPPLDNINGLPVYTPQTGCERFGKECLIIVTLNNYLLDDSIYNDIQKTLFAYGFSAPYYIHEFSAGYVPGANKIASEKEVVKRVFSSLSDDLSKEIFLKFIGAIQQNFSYGMMFSQKTFGMESPFELKSKYDSLIPEKKNDMALYCLTNDWDQYDPDLLCADNFKQTVYFYPFKLYRLKLKEWFHKNNILWDKVTILNKTLSLQNKQVTLKKFMFLGGTPLMPDRYDEIKCDAVSIDKFMEQCNGERLGFIKLDVFCEYEEILSGGINSINLFKPVISVNGFSEPIKLCSTIMGLNKLLPKYKLYLRRYQHENPIKGYSIYCIAD